MRIFLTGIKGFLGSHIARELSRQGHHVIGLIRSDIKPSILNGYFVEYHKGDLLEPESYDSVLKKCDVVIHTAAIALFGLKKPENYYKVNYEGTKLLIEYAEKNGIERFIHTSTRGTFGVSELPEQSDETCEKINIDYADDYVKSKYMAEKVVLEFSKKKRMFCMVLSPTAVVGDYDERPTPIGQIILSLLSRKYRVYMNGGINLIDVDDVALAFVFALNKGEDGQIYILGNKNTTLYELFHQLSIIGGISPPKIRIPFSFAYIASFFIENLSKIKGNPPFVTRKKVVSLYKNYSYCNSEKAIHKLGLPQTALVHTLEKIVKWFKDNQYIES